jgi:hypothetical protein
MSAENGYMECPYCAEAIKVGAMKCKHCKSEISALPVKNENASFMQKIFGKRPKEKAISEIKEYLRSRDVVTWNSTDISFIASEYKVDLRRDFLKDIINIYREYLQQIIDEDDFSIENINKLEKLRTILNINEDEASSALTEISKNKYKEQVENIVECGKCNDNDLKALNQIAEKHNIPDEEAKVIYRDCVMVPIQDYLENIIRNGVYSPSEEAELERMRKAFKIDINYDDDSARCLETCKLSWQIQNGILPVCEVPINLTKKESCHFFTEANWLEQVKITQRYNYSGPTMRIRIAKGIYWRAGSMAVKPMTTNELKVIDTGRLYLTNKRLLFMGTKGNKTINLSKILEFIPYSDGVGIEKDSGKSPILQFTDRVDIFAMTLSRLINEI